MNSASVGGGYVYRGTDRLDDPILDERGTPIACRGKSGTTAGYWQHRRRCEKPCDPCREAHNAYIRERRQVDDGKARRAADMRARTRAWRELARRHRAEYRLLLQAELSRCLPEATTTTRGADDDD